MEHYIRRQLFEHSPHSVRIRQCNGRPGHVIRRAREITLTRDCIHGGTSVDQPATQVRADKTSRSSDDYARVAPVTCWFQDAIISDAVRGDDRRSRRADYTNTTWRLCTHW